jgi:hypothetical protein
MGAVAMVSIHIIYCDEILLADCVRSLNGRPIPEIAQESLRQA